MTHKNDFDDAFPQDRQIGGSHYKNFLIQPYVYKIYKKLYTIVN